MKLFLLPALFALLTLHVKAQKMNYTMSFPNAIHHEAHIELKASGIPLKAAVFRMSRSSAGRYAKHEFGKNVYDVTAADQNGRPLTVNRIDGDIYEVPKHSGTIRISYTLYANYPDGTYAGIDPESIHLNMPACFMWMQEMDKAPIEITFLLPKENKGVIATQLVPTAAPNTFTAPGLQYFMDSPTKIGDQLIREWRVSNPDGKHFTVRIALESNATEAQADDLAAKIKKMVEEERAVFGEFPNYDHGTYTFIAGVNPYVQSDGMEHRNSTMITVPLDNFSTDRVLGVFSHEYFHNWNVKRIRPKTLEPFDFTRSNMSYELWCAEGFTQYYGELLLARAGLQTSNAYLSTAAGLINIKQNTPGAKFYSPIESSEHAVFFDAAVSIDNNNYANMFTSYYTYGAAVALALDLEMQTRFHKTIDAFMKAMWKRFGKNEIPYNVPLMQETLSTVTNTAFAADFFTKYIYGHEQPDYAGLFAKAGYDIKNKNEDIPSIGWPTGRRVDPNKLSLERNSVRGTTIYEAGIDIGDEITKIDGNEVKSLTEMNNIIKQKKVGDAVRISYKHRGTERQTTALLKEQTGVTLVPFEQSGKTVTDDMKKIRDSWFSSQVKDMK